MVLFSRSFVRKRMISLATTASVSAISFAFAEDPARTDRFRGATPIQYVANRINHSAQQPFPSKNDAASSRITMDITVKPTGDVDRDFAAMMAPSNHHGSVAMAKAELKYGHDERLRRLAQEIVARQPRRELTMTPDAAGERRSSVAQSPAPVTWLFSQAALQG